MLGIGVAGVIVFVILLAVAVAVGMNEMACLESKSNRIKKHADAMAAAIRKHQAARPCECDECKALLQAAESYSPS